VLPINRTATFMEIITSLDLGFVPIADIYITVLKSSLLINSRHTNKQKTNDDRQEPQAQHNALPTASLS
jgi:hypothetical protein